MAARILLIQAKCAQRFGVSVRCRERPYDRLALDMGVGAKRIAEDVEGADLSGVTGTPTFFVDGRRQYGPYDIASLSAAVRPAEAHGHLESLEARNDTSPRVI